MFFLKVHKIPDGEVVAVCDEELVGKELVEGDVVIKISEAFYKGELVDEDTMVSVVSQAKNANVFGNKAVECLIKHNVIKKENTRMFGGQAHAQIYVI
jgi:hypothetical protein